MGDIYYQHKYIDIPNKYKYVVTMAEQEEISTRTDSNVPAIRRRALIDSKDIDERYLPRNSDVLAYYYYVRNTLLKYNTKQSTVIRRVATKVTEIWSKTRIKIIATNHVCNKVVNALNMLKEYDRKLRNQNTTSNVDVERERQLQFLNTIFDVLHPKCKCSCANIRYCCCSFKDSLREDYIFFLDQTTDRNYTIDEYYNDLFLNQSNFFEFINSIGIASTTSKSSPSITIIRKFIRTSNKR